MGSRNRRPSADLPASKTGASILSGSMNRAPSMYLSKQRNRPSSIFFSGKRIRSKLPLWRRTKRSGPSPAIISVRRRVSWPLRWSPQPSMNSTSTFRGPPASSSSRRSWSTAARRCFAPEYFMRPLAKSWWRGS